MVVFVLILCSIYVLKKMQIKGTERPKPSSYRKMPPKIMRYIPVQTSWGTPASWSSSQSSWSVCSDSSHSLQSLHLPYHHTGERLIWRRDRRVSPPVVMVKTFKIRAQVNSRSKVWTILNPAIEKSSSWKKFGQKRVKSRSQSRNRRFTHFTHPLAAHLYACQCACSPNPTTCS